MWKSKCFKDTTGSAFWKLRCSKSARRSGAKHISMSKGLKHLSVGALLEVEMLKKYMLLWCEAHFEFKTLKTPHVRSTFGSWDVEKVHAAVAGSTFRSQACKKRAVSEHILRLGCGFAWQAQWILHVVKSEPNAWVYAAQYKRNVDQRC